MKSREGTLEGRSPGPQPGYESATERSTPPALSRNATVIAAEGARVGFVTCAECGAALLLDPREPVNVPDLHAAWHTYPDEGNA
jgi:hypothetical protein